ncbi:MAG: GNAT family N-acetyltransferase [Myxococcota bacterium]
MERSDVVLRRAAPTDAPFLAWAMIEAERGTDPEGEWDAVLPGPPDAREALLARIATTEPEHFCHWSRFLVAEHAGEPVATLSGYIAARHTHAHFRRAWYQAFLEHGHSVADALDAWARFGPFQHVSVDLPPEAWRVEWVAVHPAWRGKGLVGALLEANFARARAEGCDRAVVATALENAPARRAYEAAGFVAFARWEHDDYRQASGSAGNVYLRRSL